MHSCQKLLLESVSVWTKPFKFVQVREIVAVLDLDVLFYPCPRNSPNFRPKVAQMGGKQQFPYMVIFFFFEHPILGLT